MLGSLQKGRRPCSLQKKPSSLIPVRVRRPLAAVQTSGGRVKLTAKSAKTATCTPLNTAPTPRQTAHTLPHSHPHTVASQNRENTAPQEYTTPSITPRNSQPATTASQNRANAAPREHTCTTPSIAPHHSQPPTATPHHSQPPTATPHHPEPPTATPQMSAKNNIRHMSSKRSGPHHTHWIHGSGKVGYSFKLEGI